MAGVSPAGRIAICRRAGAHGRFHSGRHADLASLRDLRRRPDRGGRAGRLPDGVRALRAQSEHHLADRFRHLQPGRRDLHRQPLCAAHPRPRQRGRAAALSWPNAPLLAGALRVRDGARVLPGDGGAHLPVLARGLGEMGVRHRCGGRGCGFPMSMPIGLGLLTLQYVAEILKLVSGREPPFGSGRRREASSDKKGAGI